MRLIFVLGIAFAAASMPPAPARADAADTSYTSPDLGATTAEPWNPPEAVASQRVWERVVRFPGRVLSLPLVGLGNLAERGTIAAENAHLEQRVARLLAEEAEWGIGAGPASLGDATGLGAALRWAPPPLHQHVIGEITASTQHDNREAVTLGAGPLAAGYVSEWRPRERFYGIGTEALHTQVSSYAASAQSARLVASWGWGVADPMRQPPARTWLAPGMLALPGRPHRIAASAWIGPREAAVSRGRDPARASFDLVHPAEAAGSLDRRIEQLDYGAGVSWDAREGVPHWSRGWRAALTIDRFEAGLDALEFRHANTDARAFTRYDGRAATGVSFGGDPRTLRLTVHVVDQQLDSGPGTLLVSDLATLGGSELAGYDPGRFRDVDLVFGRLAYLYPLGKHLEFDLHGETGQVASRLDALDVSRFRSSAGAALRFRTELAVFGMVGVDASNEQVRLRFSIGSIE